MNPERHQRVMQILGEAIERDPEAREFWIETACTGDDALRAEVARLLSRQKPAAQFLEESPLVVAAEANSRSMIGERVGLYKIISEIGRGGMGAVYLAERDDQQFTRRVAVKLVKRGMDTDFVVQRFRNERQILANLDHPQIARLLDGGATEADLPYFIMEYVEGDSIIKYANANKLSTAARLRLFRSVCAAVQYAHQNLVIHRDLKPSNILVTKNGEPKLLDFGIAKLLQADGEAEIELTATAVRVMTPEYASPEQIRGERISTSSDIYSLGVLLYELLTGQRPYRYKSRQPEEIAKAICEQEPAKPSLAVTRRANDGVRPKGSNRRSAIGDRQLKGDLDNIILKALRKEPQRRYASVEQFSEDIHRHLAGLPVSAQKDTLSYRTSKFVQRNKIAAAAAALIVLVLLGGIAATAWEARRARAESAKAQQRFMQVRKLAHSVLFDYHDEVAALPGATKVRERMVKDALEYLDNLSQEAGGDTSLMRELAAAYEKVAAVQGGNAASARGTVLSTSNLGNTPGAIASLAKAVAIRERLAALEPNNPETRNELGFSYGFLAEDYLLTGPPEKTAEYGRKTITVLEMSRVVEPGNEDVQYRLLVGYLAVAKALGNPAVANLGDTKGALEYINKAQGIAEKLAADHPTNLAYQQALGGLYNADASILGSIGKQSEQLAANQRAMAVDQALVKQNASNTLYQSELAIQLGNLGGTMLRMGDNNGALENFKQAQEIYDSLVAADPNDAGTRRNSAVGYRNLGTARAATGDRSGAPINFRKALQIFAELVAGDPKNPDLRRQWATSYLSLSKFQSQTDDLNGAVDSAGEGIKIAEALVAASPTNASANNTLALMDLQLGAAHAALAAKTGPSKGSQEWRAARDAYQKSLDIFQDMKNKGTLKGADVSKLDELAKEISRCEAALKS
jgi:eukaryotic-like serine/threonine-protein kinase